MIILSTSEFLVECMSDKPPHHSRENGGHIQIVPKYKCSHRYELPLDLAARLTYMTMLVGEATTIALQKNGIDIVRINYQNNGNWAYKVSGKFPQLHEHLYFRTAHEKHPDNDPRFQAFPEALTFPDRATGYYDKFMPYTQQECDSIYTEIVRLSNNDKYKDLDLLLELEDKMK